MGTSVAALEQAAGYARHVQDPVLDGRILVATASAYFHGPTPVEHVLSWLDAEGAKIQRHLPTTDLLRAALAAMLGRFDDARRLIEGAFERLAELGVHAGGPAEYSWRVETLAGDHVAAVREARRGIELLEGIGEAGVRSTMTCMLAQSLYALGEYDEAEATLTLGDELSASDDLINQILVRQVRGKLIARKGEHNGGERLACEAVEIAEHTDWLDIHGDALLDFSDVLAFTGQSAEAATMLERALRLYEQKGNLVSAAKARAVLVERGEAVATEP
jgi:tetratricopeptide (TPR) repeat protein